MGFITRQLRKAPGEWIRAHILDWCVEKVAGLGFFKWIAAALAFLSGITEGLLASAKHDPAIAVLLGFAVAAAAAVIVLALALGWQAFRKQIVPLHSKTHLGETSTPLPDMRIRELFFHIHPHPFADDADKQSVGSEVIDNFSTGQLLVWGRLIGRSDQTRSALTTIQPNEWHNAKFTYWFLDEGHEKSLHVECRVMEPGIAPRQYADLRVNQAQADKIWGWLSLKEAARLMYETLQGSVMARIAERERKTPDGILEWFGDHLVLNSPITAQRLPSTRQIELSEDDRRFLKAIDGCETLVGVYGDPVTYVKPMVQRSEIARSVDLLEAMGRPFKC